MINKATPIVSKTEKINAMMVRWRSDALAFIQNPTATKQTNTDIRSWRTTGHPLATAKGESSHSFKC